MRIHDLLNNEDTIQEGDHFDLELGDLLIESVVLGFYNDGIVISADSTALAYFKTEALSENFKLTEFSDMDLAIMEGGGTIDEAKYQGKTVPLGKRLPGDVKKSKVYVRKPDGNVVKVNFGDKTMRIKKSNPERRKSFRARHNCDSPGPRWKAKYWSCRAW